MTQPTTKISQEQAQQIREASEGLFADAVAHGMHSPFGLEADYWGREYADRLLRKLAIEDEDE